MQTYDERVTQAWRVYQGVRDDAAAHLDHEVREAQAKYRITVSAAFDRYLQAKEQATRGEQNDV